MAFARVIRALRGSIVACFADVIGDAEDRIAAEGNVGGGEGACDIGVGEGWGLVDLGAVLGAQT